MSFSVYSDDESRARWVWVRLRAYPEGRQTEYRGERFPTFRGGAWNTASGDLRVVDRGKLDAVGRRSRLFAEELGAVVG